MDKNLVTILHWKAIFYLSSPDQLGILSNQQLIPKRYSDRRMQAPYLCVGKQGGLVGVAEILAQIDREIAQLQRARTLLKSGSNGSNGNGSIRIVLQARVDALLVVQADRIVETKRNATLRPPVDRQLD